MKGTPRQPVLYPDEYTWLLLVSAMDLMLTWLILQLGGREVNPVANAVLRMGGFGGMIVFKFAAVVVFVLACEAVGRMQWGRGRSLARVAVGISAVPIVVSLAQLAASA